ncbi:MAG: 4Fe-4S dicluster domain-containing protein [Breznakibacter sp.]|nr:4Fe-4S dicluster domain-containing protein [Breznakibacter sp.]
MGKISDLLRQDFRYHEALNSCMGCGKCSAICPAAAYYPYDPRLVCTLVERNDEQTLEELLSSDTIWQCGMCMSCKTRCPRGNTPGLLIMALRKASTLLGFFDRSELGRQQKLLLNLIGKNLVNTGYCVSVDLVEPTYHPEQGPIWQWVHTNRKPLLEKLDTGYGKVGSGALRNLSTDDMGELDRIFEVTGGYQFMKMIDESDFLTSKPADQAESTMNLSDGN